ALRCCPGSRHCHSERAARHHRRGDRMRRREFISLLGGAAAAWPLAVRAQQVFPTRPVHFILPFGAGSASDTTARLFAGRLSARWGKPVVVENRPGGDGLVSLDAFVGAHDSSPSGTRGGSRVPEWGPLGSVRGALSNERPYRDRTSYHVVRAGRYPQCA